MTLALHVVLTTFKLDNSYLVVTAMTFYSRRYLATLYQGGTNLDIVTIGDHQDIGKVQVCTDLFLKLFNTQGLTLGYTILLATGFNYRVHCRFSKTKTVFDLRKTGDSSGLCRSGQSLFTTRITLFALTVARPPPSLPTPLYMVEPT